MPVDIVLVALHDRREISRFPALLRNAGARVTLLGNPRVTMAWSRFVDRKIPCGPEPLGISLAMRALIRQYDSPPWLICCDDASLAAVAQCREEQWVDRMLPVDQNSRMLDAIFSKCTFAQMTRGLLPLVPSMNCATVEEATEAARTLGLPVAFCREIDGPRINQMIVNDLNQIAPAFSRMNNGQLVMVQKQIAGNTGSCDVLFHRGRVVCWSGWFTSGRPAIDPLLEEILSSVGTLTKFQGFAGIDWIQDQSGKFQIQRFHATPTAGLQRARLNGVNFSRALWEMFHGMLRIQKPFATGSHGILPVIARIPWNDPGLLLRSFLDLTHLRKTA